MNHIVKPNHIGTSLLLDIDPRTLVPYIHWSFFFMAWRLTGKFDGIASTLHCPACKMAWLRNFPEDQRPKAEEAMKLYKDATDMLDNMIGNKVLRINASIGLYPAHADEQDTIFVEMGEKEIALPTLRQQHPSTDGFCYSLADYIAPEKDYIGAFATTVQGADEFASGFEKTDDMYSSILIKTLSDRLAEAAAEWLHYQVRKTYWAYAPDEKEDIEEMYKVHYRGIRPAVGYPSLPDQSIIFELDPMLQFNEIGITLTENGAMYPNASVCGLYFAHPQSKYFMIGKIDEQQLEEYALRRGRNKGEMKKWLGANI